VERRGGEWDKEGWVAPNNNIKIIYEPMPLTFT
jgi:hypothetical protein